MNILELQQKQVVFKIKNRRYIVRCVVILIVAAESLQLVKCFSK